MLTAIRQSDKTKVLARIVVRAESPFLCPLCLREVILRKGKIKVHHFAHKPPVTCSLGAGETEEHHRAKLAIYDALRVNTLVSDVELEKDLGGSVADVYARISGVRVAVEIQRSSLTVNEIVARTQNYHRLQIAVLWIGLTSPDLTSPRYTLAHGKNGVMRRTTVVCITGRTGRDSELFTLTLTIFMLRRAAGSARAASNKAQGDTIGFLDGGAPPNWVFRSCLLIASI
ncbi:MAG: competence protein CoiA [Candidatus Binataceae bacterium]